MGSYPVAACRGKTRIFGGTSFSPIDIPNLIFWVDFSDISTLFQDSLGVNPVTADGDVIGRINDKSLNGYNGTQATTANKPIYKVNVQNGLSVGRSDGINDFLSTPPIPMSTNDISVFVIASMITQGGANIILEMSTNATANDGFWLAGGTNSVQGAGGLIRGTSTEVGLLTNDPFGGTGNWRIMELFGDAANLNNILYRNGVSINTGVTNFGNIGSDSFYIFARSGGLLPSNINLGEIIVYNSALSLINRNSVISYAQNKWGIP